VNEVKAMNPGSNRWLDPGNRWLLLAACCGQVSIIALPLVKYSEIVPITIVLVLLSAAALFGSVTTALLYLCLISAVIPTRFFDDYLMLPLDFKFYEGLLVIIVCLAGASWIFDQRRIWRRTRLDVPVLALLMVVTGSVFLGLFYGQNVWQILRDVRFPLYYGIFFVVTAFFDVDRSKSFLMLVLVSAATVGVEYIVEFLQTVDLSFIGNFYRVARTEGLLLPIGALVVVTLILFDNSSFRKLLATLSMVPIGLALVLTMGRAMWVCLLTGLAVLVWLVISDPRASANRGRRILILLMAPFLLVAGGHLFQRVTGVGVEEMVVRRLQGAVNYTGGDQSIASRFIAYKAALDNIQQRPLLGGGHGATVTYMRADENGKPYLFTSGKVDNLYLTLWMRMGIAGIVVFLWVFYRALVSAYHLFNRTRHETTRLFCAGFLAIYTAMLVYGMADSTMIGNRLIFIHAVFLGILAQLDARERIEDEGAYVAVRTP
jgi:O-antigen ligase